METPLPHGVMGSARSLGGTGEIYISLAFTSSFHLGIWNWSTDVISGFEGYFTSSRDSPMLLLFL
jgi:hypothetical protein